MIFDDNINSLEKTFNPHSEGWKTKRIGDIFDYKNGRAHEKKIVDEGPYNLITLNSVDMEGKLKETHSKVETGEWYLQKDDLVMVLSDIAHGNLIGRVARIPVDNKYVLNQRMGLLRNKTDNCVRFLQYLINFKQRNFKRLGQGTSQLNLNKNDILNFKISLPSLFEQQKIASILSTWDELIGLYEKKEKLSKLRLRGVIQRIFENQSDWKEYRLDEIAEIYQPKTLSAKNMTGGDYRVFGANGYIGYHNEYNHEQSQVTVSCRGENTGTVNLVEGKTWITGNSMVLNVDVNSNLNKKFLYFYLKNQNLKYLVTGSGQPQIIRRDIATHRIKLPSLNKQEEIVEFLDVLEKEIELTKKLIVQLQEQKRGLMQLLLTGKVRV